MSVVPPVQRVLPNLASALQTALPPQVEQNRLVDFTRQISERVVALQEKKAAVDTLGHDMLLLHGEQPEKSEPTEYCERIANILVEFERALADNERQAVLAAKRQRLEESKRQREAEREEEKKKREEERRKMQDG